MTYTVEIQERTIEYAIRLSKKAKRKQIQIKEGGRVTVVLPAFRGYRHPQKYAHKLLIENKAWILNTIDAQPQHPWTGTPEEYTKYKDVAREQILSRLRLYNAHYGFTYHNVSVRNQSSRWGSCSENGNLSFNYRLIFLPKDQFDYVIVHELCHLQELNHSVRFWDLVKQTIPDARTLAQALP